MNRSFQATAKIPGKPAPGPVGLPFLGVIPQLRKGALQFFLKAALQYGDVVRLDMGPRKLFLVTHPDQVKYILQDNNRNYTKGYDIVKPLLGEGLVTSDGESWRRQRRLMQPVFNHDRIAKFADVMVEETQRMLGRWLDHHDLSQPLNVASEMMRLTQSIILRTMFSTSLGSQGPRLSQAFHDSLEYFNSILLRPVRFLNQLPTPTNQRFHQAVRVLDDYIYHLIAERRKHKEEADDLLSMLISSHDEATGEGMPDQQIRDELMTIFLAGHETTANLLGWTWFMLSKNPPISRLVQAEVETVVGSRQVAFTDLSNLSFTRMVLDESLRMYPPVWMFGRRSIDSDEISGCYIPPHSMVTLSPYVTHHLPAWWPNPDGFDPYRFAQDSLDDQSEGVPVSKEGQLVKETSFAERRPRYAYFPFGGGPRQCIGNNFAMMEAQVIVTTVLQSCRLELVPGARVEPRPLATLRPWPSLPMVVAKK